MYFTKFGLAAQSLLVSFGLLAIINPLYATDGPWRLSDALGFSENFSLSGEHQARFEHYDGTVQLGVSNNDKILFLRTTLKAEYNNGGFSTQLEIQDAGQQLADKDADIRNIHASVIDILQASLIQTSIHTCD